MTTLNFRTDVLGQNAYAPDLSETVWRAKLTANTVAALTVPTGMNRAWIEAEGDFWVSTDTPTVPTGVPFTAGYGQQNPCLLTVTAADILNFISVTSIRISVAFYSVA